MKLLIAKELELHKHETRSSKSRLRKLLHSEFVEIGYSGQTWDFNSIVESLTAESDAGFLIHAQQFSCEELQQGIYLLIYKTVQIGKGGQRSRFAKRTSIWMRTDSKWQMRFHQATACEEFEISASGI